MGRPESRITLGAVRRLQLDMIGLSKEVFLLRILNEPRGRWVLYKLTSSKDTVYARLCDWVVLNIEET
jgi:hypothetical protein